MPAYVKVVLFDLPSIVTYADIGVAFSWCCTKFGAPSGRWRYGRVTPSPYGSEIISSPEEIEYFTFEDSEDALLFKLRFS